MPGSGKMSAPVLAFGPVQGSEVIRCRVSCKSLGRLQRYVSCYVDITRPSMQLFDFASILQYAKYRCLCHYEQLVHIFSAQLSAPMTVGRLYCDSSYVALAIDNPVLRRFLRYPVKIQGTLSTLQTDCSSIRAGANIDLLRILDPYLQKRNGIGAQSKARNARRPEAH